MEKTTIPLVILLTAALGASTVIPLSLSQISTLAHRVVTGRIERITSHQDPSSGRILSKVEIAQPAPQPSLVFEMTGGTVGDLRQWIAGFPSFQVGDRVVLFLAEDTTTPLGPTVGLHQGVFFVEPDNTITDHRRRPISGIRGENLVLSDGSGSARLKLETFLQKVQSLKKSAATERK
ncbi:MAG: hypothetical protein HY238_04785 [Acidobacteria bacterium]|nr:hypothetical protein [Acidobacteriota bacterium]